MNTTRTDLHLPAPGSRRPHAVRPGSLPQSLFVAELLGRELGHIAHDRFRGSTPVATLEELSSVVLIRADREADEVEALVRLPGGAVALIDTGYGHIRIEVAARTAQAAQGGGRLLRQALEAAPPVPERISVAFWMRGEGGGTPPGDRRPIA